MKTPEQIRIVKALLNQGLFYTQIQEITGIDKSKICRIARQDLGMKRRNTEKISESYSCTINIMRAKGRTINQISIKTGISSWKIIGHLKKLSKCGGQE